MIFYGVEGNRKISPYDVSMDRLRDEIAKSSVKNASKKYFAQGYV